MLKGERDRARICRHQIGLEDPAKKTRADSLKGEPTSEKYIEAKSIKLSERATSSERSNRTHQAAKRCLTTSSSSVSVPGEGLAEREDKTSELLPILWGDEWSQIGEVDKAER